MRLTIAAIVTVAVMWLGALQSTTRADDAWRSVWDGVYTKEQQGRGQALYNQQCSACHGDMLTGGDAAPALAGGEFLANWNGLTVGDLFERVRKTMPLSKPGKLSRQVNADIVAYILNVNRFPTGSTELPCDTELLKQIRLEMVRPEEQKKQ
ncbi:MAG TPA: c-type cytochrome [Bryobacteraceae bacterium]|nr:c-type cytochrome [Bryobacteraceae bacterium]